MNLEAQIREAVTDRRYYPDCKLYDINENLLAKPRRNLLYAQREFEIGIILYQNGIQVPQFHKFIFLCDFDENKREYPYYIVMDKIDGTLGEDLRGDIKDFAIRQLLVEVDKIIDSGINPRDCNNPGNAIFNFEENKMYVIDFGLYDFIDTHENILEVRKQIKSDIIFEYNRFQN